jgi:hypothetical protein
MIRLITFGDGSTAFKYASIRLAQQAKKFNEIDDVKIYDLTNISKEYWNLFSKKTTDQKVGLGLWSWKPYIIYEELNKLNYGDILIYLDAGCELNSHGKKRFHEYIQHTKSIEYLLFHLKNKNHNWTKLHPKFNDPNFLSRNQLVGGIIFLKKTDPTINFINDWLRLCHENNAELLHDPKEGSSQRQEFIAHRHDQSCLSLAAHIHQLISIPDETDFSPWIEGKNYPILALRNISSRQRYHYYFLPKILRKLIRATMRWKWL